MIRSFRLKMLPDYPDIKRELQRRLVKSFELLVDQKAPVMARIRRNRQTEGDKFIIEDEEGNAIKRDFVEIEARVEVPISEPIAEAASISAEQFERAAEEIARQSEGLIFTTLQEAVESVGNAIDARGQSFHPSMMWDAIERMHLDFDQNGRPEMPIIVLQPDAFEAIRAKLPGWEADPMLQKRRKEVLAKKKEEWRDRESNRKLVG